METKQRGIVQQQENNGNTHSGLHTEHSVEEWGFTLLEISTKNKIKYAL